MPKYITGGVVLGNCSRCSYSALQRLQLYLEGLVPYWIVSIHGTSRTNNATTTWLAVDCSDQSYVAAVGSMLDNVGDDGAIENECTCVDMVALSPG